MESPLDRHRRLREVLEAAFVVDPAARQAYIDDGRLVILDFGLIAGTTPDRG